MEQELQNNLKQYIEHITFIFVESYEAALARKIPQSLAMQYAFFVVKTTVATMSGTPEKKEDDALSSIMALLTRGGEA